MRVDDNLPGVGAASPYGSPLERGLGCRLRQGLLLRPLRLLRAISPMATLRRSRLGAVAGWLTLGLVVANEVRGVLVVLAVAPSLLDVVRSCWP